MFGDGGETLLAATLVELSGFLCCFTSSCAMYNTAASGWRRGWAPALDVKVFACARQMRPVRPTGAQKEFLSCSLAEVEAQEFLDSGLQDIAQCSKSDHRYPTCNCLHLLVSRSCHAFGSVLPTPRLHNASSKNLSLTVLA